MPDIIEELLTHGERALEGLLKSRGKWKRHAQTILREIVQRGDLVTREEFDVTFGMLRKARMNQEELDKRLRIVETKLGMSNAAKPQRKKMKRVRASLRSVKHDKRGER